MHNISFLVKDINIDTDNTMYIVASRSGLCSFAAMLCDYQEKFTNNAA